MKSKQLMKQKRLHQFVEEFLKHGNATRAAENVFNPSTKASAAALGCIYLKKAQPYISAYMEDQGYGFARMIKILLKKVEEGNDIRWFDLAMRIAGYDQFYENSDSPKQGAINMYNIQQKVMKKYVTYD